MGALRSTVPVLLLIGAAAPLQAQPTTVASAKKLPSHPGEVALVDEGQRGSVYRSFPSGQRLYTFDRDPPGQSACLVGCAMAWPPVLAPSDAVTTGDWTVIARSDGGRQWALKGKPVYTRFHDAPDAPGGEAVSPSWHLVPYAPVGATRTVAKH